MLRRDGSRREGPIAHESPRGAEWVVDLLWFREYALLVSPLRPSRASILRLRVSRSGGGDVRRLGSYPLPFYLSLPMAPLSGGNFLGESALSQTGTRHWRWNADQHLQKKVPPSPAGQLAPPDMPISALSDPPLLHPFHEQPPHSHNTSGPCHSIPKRRPLAPSRLTSAQALLTTSVASHPRGMPGITRRVRTPPDHGASLTAHRTNTLGSPINAADVQNSWYRPLPLSAIAVQLVTLRLQTAP